MDNNVVTQAVLACVAFGDGRATDPKHVAALVAIRNSLATVFSVIARGIANDPKYVKWVADTANPGYLVSRNRSFELRAPWNVMIDLPDEESLEEFLEAAARVKFRGESVLCLSGSSLTQSKSTTVGDIDLCEYVADDQVFADVARESINTVAADLLCIQVSAYIADGLQPRPTGLVLRRPWTTTSAQAFLDRVQPAATGKCDFAVITTSSGPMEMTKIVLSVDPRYPDTEGSWELSFPYQEMGIGPGTWVPRRLATPPAIARYVVWLFRQVETLAPVAPTKAAKRALSLARILNSAALADSAKAVLAHQESAFKAALRSRAQFHDRLVDMNDPGVGHFRMRLEQAIQESAKHLGIAAGDQRDATDTTPNGTKFTKLIGSLDKPGVANDALDRLRSEFRRLIEPALRMGRY